MFGNTVSVISRLLSLRRYACLLIGRHLSYHNWKRVISSSDTHKTSLLTKSRLLGITLLLIHANDDYVNAEQPVADKKEYITRQVIDELKALLRDDQIELDSDELKARGKPWNSYHKSSHFPDVIVLPETTAEVSSILQLCNKHSFPVIAYGGGTSIEGHTLATRRGLSLDLNRMKSIISFNESDLDITVQPGLGYIELNDVLKEKGLWFPLDPGPGASIGGMCATRCSGSTAVRYGSMRENVLSLTAVLSDGTVIKTGNRARKSSAGYDIARLLIGSEGTLGIITEITLKLHGIPKVSNAVRISFPSQVKILSNDSESTTEISGIEAAARTARDTLNCGVVVGRCELLDDKMIEIINSTTSESQSTRIKWPEMTTLLYELPGISNQSVNESISIIRHIAAKNGAIDVDIEVATDPEACAQMWRVRKECLWSAMSRYPDREALVTDVCVPLSELPGLIQQTKLDIPQGIPCPIVAHAGDGNFHVVVMFDPTSSSELAEVKRFSKNMALQAISRGGTCTGEHGIGSGKKELLKIELGADTVNLMSKLKLTFDPNLILNPDKVIDIPDQSPSCTCKQHTKLCI